MRNWNVFHTTSSRLILVDENAEVENKTSEKEKTNINVGTEHIKKVEVFFCELCRLYLPCKGETEATILKRHCSTRSHLKLYIRYKDDRSLRLEAERIHRKKQKEVKDAKDKKGMYFNGKNKIFI